MHSAEFLELIQVLKEDRSKEFKGSTPWKEKTFQCKIIKTILALSNLKDGGCIIFGVKEPCSGEFKLEGMDDAHLETYKEDDIASLVAEYADPFVKIKLDRINYYNKKFIVIQVDEFHEIPVLCKKDGIDIRRGAMYVRSTRIPETVEVPSQTEMREVLELAVAKNIRKFYRIQALAGIRATLPEIDDNLFDRQIKDFAMMPIVEKIKQRGYWIFRIRPKLFEEKLIEDLNTCHTLIRDCKVSLRGWDFPYYNEYSNECTNADGYIQCPIDRGKFVEYWRFYQSAQFYFLKGFYRDWDGQKQMSYVSKKKNATINIQNIVYTLTEVFEFAVRLATRGILGNVCVIELSLNNCKDRILSTDPGRHLSGEYKCAVPVVAHKEEITTEKLLRDSALLSRKAMYKVFQLFNWRHISVNQFQNDQENFLNRR